MIDSFRGKYGFLSNFHPAPTDYKGVLYVTSEHAYMSAKSDDPRWKAFCADGSNKASLVKAKSYELGELMVDGWDGIKFNVMKECLISKFSREGIRQDLIDTGNEYLREVNTWGDVYWGVCNGVGENNLGILQMWIRDETRMFNFTQVQDMAEKFADARINGFEGTFKDWEVIIYK